MDQANGRVYVLCDVHALVMSCPHREEQLKDPQSIAGSSFDLDCPPALSRLASVAAPTLQASQVLLIARCCLCSPIYGLACPLPWQKVNSNSASGIEPQPFLVSLYVTFSSCL